MHYHITKINFILLSFTITSLPDPRFKIKEH